MPLTCTFSGSECIKKHLIFSCCWVPAPSKCCVIFCNMPPAGWWCDGTMETTDPAAGTRSLPQHGEDGHWLGLRQSRQIVMITTGQQDPAIVHPCILWGARGQSWASSVASHLAVKEWITTNKSLCAAPHTAQRALLSRGWCWGWGGEAGSNKWSFLIHISSSPAQASQARHRGNLANSVFYGNCPHILIHFIRTSIISAADKSNLCWAAVGGPVVPHQRFCRVRCGQQVYREL